MSLWSGGDVVFLHRIKIGKTMIHVSKLFEVVQMHETFSLSWVSEKGELVEVEECRCTSFHSSGRTMNVQLKANGQFRKVNRFTVVAFNGVEVFL